MAVLGSAVSCNQHRNEAGSQVASRRAEEVTKDARAVLGGSEALKKNRVRVSFKLIELTLDEVDGKHFIVAAPSDSDLKEGDRILSINGVSVEGKKLGECLVDITPQEEFDTVSVQRDGLDTPIEAKLIRHGARIGVGEGTQYYPELGQFGAASSAE